MLLPLGDDAVVFVAWLLVPLLLPGPPVENVLRALEVVRLPLHVQAVQWDLRVSWVVYVEALRAHVD